MDRMAKIHDHTTGTAWRRYLRSEKGCVQRRPQIAGFAVHAMQSSGGAPLQRGRFGDPSGAEVGWSKNAGNVNLCENPTADWLQKQRTLIFDTTYDCRFGQGTSMPVQRPCDCVVGFYRRPHDARRLTDGFDARLPERARISTPSTVSTANAHQRRIVTMIGSHRSGWI
jgi:hypothetical protein